MQLKDELAIRIKPNGDIFVDDTENGVIKHKLISNEAFINCIKDSVKIGAITSGIMPAGSFYYAARNEDFQKICIEFPSRYCDIYYEKTEYKNFPLPRLVFGFNLSYDKICNVTLGVVEEGMLKPKSQMFTYPFSNVNGFNLCCGGNKLPSIKSLHQLAGVMFYIMSMPNNNDHYHRERTKLDMELRDLFEALKDKTPEYYYKNVLVESKNTLEDFTKA